MALTMKNFNKLFQNKIVLYILLGLSFLNLLGYLAKNNLTAIIIFLLTGYGTTFFTKNMSYILLTPLLLTNFLVALFSMQRLSLKEGMDDKKENEKNEKNEKNEDVNNEDVNNEDVEEEEPMPKKETKKTSKEKELMPETFDDNDDEEESLVDTKLKSSENYENAYKNLEKMMGSKNFQNMGGSIKQIAGDQEALFKVIEKMDPLINKVGGMLDKFEGSKLSSLLPKVMGGMNKE